MSAPNSRPASYAELLEVIDLLPILVRDKRRREGLSLREAARQIEVSFSTLDRFEKATSGSNADIIIASLRWLSVQSLVEGQQP